MKRQRAMLIGSIGGLVLSGVSVAVVLKVKPLLGLWEIPITVAGVIIIFVTAAKLTRGWLAPTLLAAAGFLWIGSALVQKILVEQGSTKGVVLFLALTLALDAGILILLLAGLFVIFRDTRRRFREGWRDDQ